MTAYNLLIIKRYYISLIDQVRTMTEKFGDKWLPTEEQIDKIIIPAMQSTAKLYAGYGKELGCPPEFIALMLRDIAETFEENL